MKQQLLIGLTTSLFLTVGLLPASKASQDGLSLGSNPTTNPVLSSVNTVVTPLLAASDNTGKVGAPRPTGAGEQGIATVQPHQLSGRDAATLYVRGIPVMTFLGVNPNVAPQSKLATPNVPAATAPVAPTVQAATLAGQLNQLSRDNFDARQLRVNWNPTAKTYAIQANQQVLLTLNEQTVAPNASRDRSADALRIANLLRRQMGNAPALVAIEGKTSPNNATIVALGPVRFQLVGTSSWYGPGFHGRLTANGERYNQYAMTAAHRTLPFGTRMRVTNLANGRSVVVRVNDRGPFVYGRELDLSQGAAQMIGMMGTGTARVRMEILQ
jgi:rare lipoprotein A